MLKTYKFERLALLFLFIHVALGVFLSHYNLRYFEGTYVMEDGFIEWLTVDVLLLGCILCLYRIMKVRFKRGFFFLLSLILMAGLFFFGAMEEISWAQRILGIRAPDFFIQYNSQHELNLHNLIINGIKINKLIFGTVLGVCVVIYFLILPLLYRRVHFITRIVEKFAIPIPRILHIFAYVALALLVELTQGGKKGELLEFGGVWIFYLMVLFPKNKDIYLG